MLTDAPVSSVARSVNSEPFFLLHNNIKKVSQMGRYSPNLATLPVSLWEGGLRVSGGREQGSGRTARRST